MSKENTNALKNASQFNTPTAQTVKVSSSSVKSLPGKPSNSGSLKKPIPEINRGIPRLKSTNVVKKDILGLPIPKKTQRAEKDHRENLQLGSTSSTNTPQKLSLFEALELADSLEHNNSSQGTILSGNICPATDNDRVVQMSNICSTPREHSTVTRKTSSKKQEIKDVDVAYNRYFRALYLNNYLEYAHNKRKESAFQQLFSLNSEICRLQNEIFCHQMQTQRSSFYRKVNEIVEIQVGELSNLLLKLQVFLPIYVKFARSIDATRHKFYLVDFDVPVDENFKVPSQFCEKMSSLLAQQTNLITSIINSPPHCQGAKIEQFCDFVEQFLEISEKIEQDIMWCNQRCKQFFQLMYQSSTTKVPEILENVQPVDNLDLTMFKF